VITLSWVWLIVSVFLICEFLELYMLSYLIMLELVIFDLFYGKGGLTFTYTLLFDAVLYLHSAPTEKYVLTGVLCTGG
jgi:hypothetical protein